MRRFSRACLGALIVVGCLVSFAHATEYAALEGKNVYAGGGVLYMRGDNASGSADSDLMPGLHLLGFTEEWVWRAFVGAGFGDDELLAGGFVNYAFAHNYCDIGESGQQDCDFDVWWVGVGPTFTVYRDLFADGTGNSVDGEELGLNLSAGLTSGDVVFDVGLHYFPGSDSTLVTAGVAGAL